MVVATGVWDGRPVLLIGITKEAVEKLVVGDKISVIDLDKIGNAVGDYSQIRGQVVLLVTETDEDAAGKFATLGVEMPGLVDLRNGKRPNGDLN